MTPAPVKPVVPSTALDQLDVRVGRILDVTDVDDSDRLVQLRVDFGNHTRTIVVGMKHERPNPREIVGRQALFVVNLESRTLRGVVSQGMLFDIGHADGVTPVLACPERDVPNGTRAG